MGRIVVGIDGSDHAQEALRWALAEARLRGASLRVVQAWTTPVYAGYAAVSGAALDPALFREAAEQQVEKTVQNVVGDQTDVKVERKAVEGTAAIVLVEEAENADLLVVGSRGHGGFAGLLLGSVSQQCAQHAACPVVIVHAAPQA
ncbi:MAG TPA: universal stress protein [Gaiellaceae bacterium]